MSALNKLGFAQNNLSIDKLHCWTLSVREGDAAEIRERATLSKDGPDYIDLLGLWVAEARHNDTEAGLLYLETCHRVEIYSYGFLPEYIYEHWLMPRNVQLPRARLRTGMAAVEHMIRVTSSLESEVLGETQITGQFKDAADNSRKQGWLKGPLDRCAQFALKASKNIRSSTSLGSGTVSVAHAAIEGLDDIFDTLEGKNALVVGAGPMAIQAIEKLEQRGIKEITWINRTSQKLHNFEHAQRVTIGSYEELHRLVWGHFITVVATASPVAIVSRDQLLKNKPKGRRVREARVILDLGLPRNVVEDVGALDGFYLRNVDEFKDRAEKGTEKRREAVAKAEELLQAELKSFVKSWNNWSMGPMMGELYASVDGLRKKLLTEHFKLENFQEIDYILRSVLAKMMHRLVEEVDGLEETASLQVLETLIRAWRPEQKWLQKESPSLPEAEASKPLPNSQERPQENPQLGPQLGPQVNQPLNQQPNLQTSPKVSLRK